MQISPLLEIGRGITALVGGGGKTTLLYTLTEELRKKGTVILCTSTRIRRPEQYITLTGASEEDAAVSLASFGAVCLGETAENGKFSAPELPFSVLAQLADYVLVEADGSKGLPLKAHAPYEPVIPEQTQRVVMVVGADGFGRTVREVCHRPERYAELCGAGEDAVVTPELAARVLLAEGIGDRVYVNKVESAEDYENAAALASRLSCPVVSGSLHRGVYTCLR